MGWKGQLSVTDVPYVPERPSSQGSSSFLDLACSGSGAEVQKGRGSAALSFLVLSSGALSFGSSMVLPSFPANCSKISRCEATSPTAGPGPEAYLPISGRSSK